jgi:hypothetical protein
MRREYHSAMSRAGNVLASAVGALGVVALLAASCSSDEAAPATTVEATAAETTPPPPATDPPATDPATTIAPTTTLDPAATLAAEVEADLLEAFRLLNIGLQDPTNDEKRAAALDRFVGANREFIMDRFEEFRANGYAIRQSPSIEPVISIEVSAQLVKPSTDLVRVQICDVDSWITVEVGAGPNGTDAVVDPTLTAYRTTFFMRLVDDVWKVEGGEQVGEWQGAETCPPA